MGKYRSDKADAYTMRILKIVVDHPHAERSLFLTEIREKAPKMPNELKSHHVLKLLLMRQIRYDWEQRGRSRNDAVWYPTQLGKNVLNKYEKDKGTIELKGTMPGDPFPKGESMDKIDAWYKRHPERA